MSKRPANQYLSRLAIAATFLTLSTAGIAQAPKITTFFPIGGRAGTTVEVEVRGAGLAGAEAFLANTSGMTASLDAGGTQVDEKFKPLFQTKCQGCHELRSPANRSLTPSQWTATIDRMVKARGAPINADEQEKINQYLVGLAKAGRVTAQVKIAPNTLPGLYELRVVTAKGISTAGLFEVSNMTEVVAINGKLPQAQMVTLPCVANGAFLGNGEHHYYKFHAKQGQRLVFNMRAFRFNEANQAYFNPNLRLYDAAGKELVENHGYYDLDPLIDWTCPAEGDYVVEARDLLGRGNPGSVYRLTMGQISYDTVVTPSAVQVGANCSLTVMGKNLTSTPAYTVQAPSRSGIMPIPSPVGPQTLLVSPYPAFAYTGDTTAPVTVPAALSGKIGQVGGSNTWTLQGSGTFELEVFTTRIGSPLTPRVSLTYPNGKPGPAVNGEGRTQISLQPNQKFLLKIEDVAQSAGDTFVYAVEIRPAPPIVASVVRPANVSLRPGCTTAVEVLVTRSEGVLGDVTIQAESLPPGVTSSPAILPPDRRTAYLLLTAAADAPPAQRPFSISLTAKGASGELKTYCTPQEVYRINNNDRYVERYQCVLAVRGQPEWGAQVELTEPIKVYARHGAEVKVKILRREGFKGPVTVTMSGLPQGWVANAEEVPSNRDFAILTVRPDGNNQAPFANRDPKFSPIRAVIEVTSEGFVFVASAPVVVKGDRFDEEEKKPKK